MTDNIIDNDPSALSAAVVEMAEPWPLIAAVMGGTAAMRKARVKYLPRWPSECDLSYHTRLCTAVLFPAYQRTVSVLIGKPFSKPITIGEDVPPRIAAWLDDVDREGRNLDSFAAAVALDALTYGIAGVLVDCPPSQGARTVKDETVAGVRPYLVHVRHDAILGWRVGKVDGKTTLTQLRLMESIEEDDGAFATKLVKQVRVLTPGAWETYREAKDETGTTSWQLYGAGVTSIREIPFVPVYGSRKDYMVGEPPMLDLAYLNVEHWQSKSDQQTILHVSRVPILLLTGFESDDGGNITISAGTTLSSRNKDADARFVEHTGAAIEAGRTSILDLEDQMRQIGAELLVIKPGNTTEVQTRQDNEPGMCDLQRIMQSLEDSLDLTLYYMAQFIGEPDGGHVSIYSDFGVATLAEASAQLLATMQADGALSHATLLNELKRRGVLSAEVDVDAEIAAASEERDAAHAASAAREQAMLKASMANDANQEMAAYLNGSRTDQSQGPDGQP